MFDNKKRRNRWLLILSIILGVHLLVGAVWLKHSKPVESSVTLDSNLAVGMRSTQMAHQDAGEIPDGIGSIARSESRVDTDGVQEHSVQKSSDVIQSIHLPVGNVAAPKLSNSGLTTQMAVQPMAEGGSEERKDKPQVDCLATHKSSHAPAGFDIKVRVERLKSGGAMFVGLVNQQGEASHYVSEVKQAVQNIRFVSQDEQCIGFKTVLTVRVVP